MKVWLDGRLVDEEDAVVSVFDHGITVGDGVFETLRTYGGTLFAATRHLARLAVSAERLGLTPPPGDVLRGALDEVVAANGVADAAVRVTLTSGRGPAGSGRGGGPATVVVAAMPLPAWPATAAVAVVPWARNERSALAGVKTTSYAENVLALAWAAARGAAEAIFANLAGNVCEGTGSNVFAAVDGTLLTPPLAAGCLAGVTRALLLEAGVAVERDLSVDALRRADEAFVTSTTRGVQPVGSVDGVPLAAAPGELTARATAALAGVVAAGADP